MRHAEKPADDIDPGLSPEGAARAKKLATYIPQTFGSIGVLFASAPSKHSIRPIATITPLSAAIGVPINKRTADQDYRRWRTSYSATRRTTPRRCSSAGTMGTYPIYLRRFGQRQANSA